MVFDLIWGDIPAVVLEAVVASTFHSCPPLELPKDIGN